MTIGYVNGLKVIWNEKEHTVRIYGTDILLIGVSTKQQAIERAKVNFNNFKEVEKKGF